MLVGDDKHFRGTGDHVDADGTEDLALGGGNIGIARADNLGDGGDRLGAIGKRRNGLRAADAVDLLDARKPCCCKHRRIDLTAACRHHHNDAGNARHLRRQRIHQHRARIARRATGHIEADGIDCRPARTEADAHRVFVDIVLRPLARVVRLDAGGSDLERAQHFRLDRLDRRIDLGRADGHRRHGEIDAIEALGIFGECLIAPGAHVVDDRLDHRIDVFGHLTLGRQE
ncbi:hypothetical protein D9M72_443610 [compost metagenome]